MESFFIHSRKNVVVMEKIRCQKDADAEKKYTHGTRAHAAGLQCSPAALAIRSSAPPPSVAAKMFYEKENQ